MFARQWSGRRLGLAVASGCAMAAALGATRDASAAGDEVQFIGPWKTKFKGGGPGAPGVTVTDVANGTQLRFNPGFSSPAGGAPSATLKAKRKVRVVDADGGGVLVRIGYDSFLEQADGSATLDIGLYRGRTPVLLIPVPRHASPGALSLDTNWALQTPMPAGDYTFVVGVTYRRSAAGSYGSASPAKTPVFAECRLFP